MVPVNNIFAETLLKLRTARGLTPEGLEEQLKKLRYPFSAGGADA